MEQAGSRVPAWKRLGLTLRKEDQSGTTAPDHSRDASTRQPLEPSAVPRRGQRGDFANTPQDSESSQNGKPSRLGKRKPYDAPAEVRDHVSKKSKKGETLEESNGAAATDLVLAAQKEDALSESVPGEGHAVTKPHQRGDPNYRQKKGKKEAKAWSQKPARNAHTHQQVDSPSPTAGPDLEDGATLLPSTETDFTPLPATHHISQKLKRATLDSPPTNPSRRKSVTFTPDTKKADGNSAQSLSKAWFSGPAGADLDPALGDKGQLPSDTGVSTLNLKEDKQARRPEKKQKRSKNKVADSADPTETQEAPISEKIEAPSENVSEPSAASKLRGKKKDHSLYLAYLSQYHGDRSHWKFNKAKQNDILDNALNVFRIPEEYSEALSEYVKGLKGAGVINRLVDRCNQALKDLDAIDSENSANMDDPKVREAAREEALADRLFREKKRRQLDVDIQEVAEHPHAEAYIRRLKRRRANDLRRALNLAEPIAPTPKAGSSGSGPSDPQKPKRVRKSRTIIDDDISSSSSDESSSAESGSDSDAEAKAESDKSAASNSGSESSSESLSSSSDSSASEDSSGGESDDEKS
ncbi:hypothetical protein P154DRAFT_423256 [Amniculicola lignicola CBS 123094]|uniref:WKF domain-containing protein n=1 Tax=Amniculicola lignicola CBS 123094 TaxID=1392246 RepID=A0A6A5WW49_9PLEO|nr:hypothetical protein P154DRAFT_423256 [Amniculicola lignicola CBS 123094]